MIKKVNIMPEDEHLFIIDEIRRGNKALRYEYILKIYDRVVNYVDALELKEEYREDAIQVGIEKVIQMIDSYDFRSSKTVISRCFCHCIYEAIESYFLNNLYFSGVFYGVTYNTACGYLTAKLERKPFSKEVIMLLNNYGVSEKPLSYISAGENIPEQALLDGELRNIFQKITKGLSDRQRYILLSKTGWFGYPEKSNDELANELSCSPSTISSAFFQIKKKVCSNRSLLDYLKSKNSNNNSYGTGISDQNTEFFTYKLDIKRSIPDNPFSHLSDDDKQILKEYLCDLKPSHAYILESINGWFERPKKTIYELNCELLISRGAISIIYDLECEILKQKFIENGFDNLASLFTAGKRRKDSNEKNIQERLEEYFETLEPSTAYLLGSMNDLLDYKKKTAEQLASEFGVSKGKILYVYYAEDEKLNSYMASNEYRGRRQSILSFV